MAASGFPPLADVLDAAADDWALLAALAPLLTASDQWAEEAREIRDAAACRLRSYGVPMTRIAAAAGVSDSYLTRRALAVGHPRKRGW